MLNSLIEEYREAHDGELPHSPSDLMSTSDRQALADVFWLDQFEKELGKRPSGWPSTSAQLNENMLYRFLKHHNVKDGGIFVVESEKMRDLGSGPDGHFKAITVDLKHIRILPSDMRSFGCSE